VKIRTERIAWQEIDGELVLLDVVSSSYLTTNVSGTFLAELLREDRSRGELVAALAEKYEIDDATAGADTDAFLGSLEELELLER
jgi:hypothetical protein